MDMHYRSLQTATKAKPEVRWRLGVKPLALSDYQPRLLLRPHWLLRSDVAGPARPRQSGLSSDNNPRLTLLLSADHKQRTVQRQHDNPEFTRHARVAQLGVEIIKR